MRITQSQLRQIIREELMHLHEQEPTDDMSDQSDDSTSEEFIKRARRRAIAKKISTYLKSRSNISGYIPYSEPNYQTLIAMLPADSGGKASAMAGMVMPPKNSNVVWQVDERLQARIVMIKNALGAVDLKGASGDSMYYVINSLDMGAEISRQMGGIVLTPEDKREISKEIKSTPVALNVPVKTFFMKADATRGGTGGAPRGVVSIYIKTESNPR